MSHKFKIIRACTVPQSLGFVKGMIPDLQEKYEVALLSSSGSEWNAIREMYPDVKCIVVDMERHISPLKDLKALWLLWRVFRKEKPQIVHSMTPKAGMLCMVAAWLALVPRRVHTFTGLVFPTSLGLKRKILMAADWLTCICATHIIPEGEGVKRDLLCNGIAKKPIKVLGYGNVKGIDLEYFARTTDVMSDAAKIRKDDVMTFISIGRLVGDKGINELVSAFVRLNKDNSNTRLILVGAYEEHLDPIRSDTKQEIANNTTIEYVGRKSDVRPWLAASDVAILASYREGFPNIVIEAGAMGLPQIVTDINGANEIIQEGKNGTIVPSRNEDALYNGMKRMLDAKYRNSLAAKAREMIATRYEQGYVRQCLLDFYNEIQ